MQWGQGKISSGLLICGAVEPQYSEFKIIPHYSENGLIELCKNIKL